MGICITSIPTIIFILSVFLLPVPVLKYVIRYLISCKIRVVLAVTHVRTGMPSPPKSYRKSYNGLFEDYTQCTSKSAAEIIINAIMNGEWRVVIGEEAKAIEKVTRKDPNSIYD